MSGAGHFDPQALRAYLGNVMLDGGLRGSNIPVPDHKAAYAQGSLSIFHMKNNV